MNTATPPVASNSHAEYCLRMTTSQGEVTRLARSWAAGDEAAFDRLIDLVYDDLRLIARHHLGLGKRGGTIDTTALVHEAYVKLAGVEGGEWESRARFFSFCAKAMRRILIDHARHVGAEKRGGDRVRVTLSPEVMAEERDLLDVLALDEALSLLETRDARLARIAECRLFGGLSIPETAESLDVSKRTVERDWSRARAYLHQLLAPEPGPA